MIVVVDYHVASYLGEIKVIPPYLGKADKFKGYDMKDKHVDGVLSDED